MANGQIFISWVKTNFPTLYNKNINYNTESGIKTLLYNLNMYLQAKDSECNSAYSDIAHAAVDKTTKITAYNNFYNENKDSDTLISVIDNYVTNGTITGALSSLEFLSDLMFKFNM